MKASSLLQHIGIALILTCLAAINDFAFSRLLSSKFNISLSVFLYLAYLVWQSPLVAGRVTLLILDLSVLLICLFIGLNMLTLLLIFLAMMWLNRLLLYYSSPLAVLADLGLCLFTAGIAYWLLFNGQSLVIVLWCLLLLQALHSLIPGKKKFAKPREASSDNFDHALQSAETALQQLIK
ncbi:MAG: hypothetical protein GQ583_07325 [Methyloprofundus sp.]|nr:hypothetical protein [Methyloprofundus sp.]